MTSAPRDETTLENIAAVTRQLGRLEAQLVTYVQALGHVGGEQATLVSNTLEELRLTYEELRSHNEALSGVQRSLREERQHYQDLVEFAGEGLVVTDPAGIIREVNRASVQLLGIERRSLVGRPLLAYLRSPAGRELAWTELRERVAALGPGEQVQWEGRLNAWREVEPEVAVTVARIARPGTAEVSGLHWSLRDISAQKRSEAEARRRLLELEALYAAAPIGLSYLDRELRYLRVNEQMAAINGFSAAEHLGKRGPELMPDLEETLIPTLREVLARGEPRLNLEVSGETPAHPGEVRHWQVSHYPVRCLDDEVIGVGSVALDITERVRSEEVVRALNETLDARVQERTEELQDANKALRRSEWRFYQAFHAGPVAACLTTLGEDRFLEVNRSFETLTGYAPDEVVGYTAEELGMWSSPADRAKLARAQEADEGFYDLELSLRTEAGDLRTVLLSGEVIQLDGNAAQLKFFYDITKRKRGERDLLEAIESTLQDASWFSHQVVEKLAQIRSGNLDQTEIAELTPREQQVLILVAKGLSNAQIAADLGLAPQTVRNYLATLYDKIGIHSRAEVIVWARERGLVGP